MDRWLLSVVTCLLVIGSQISITIGSATLKVKLVEFTNPSNKKFDGSCCDVPCGTPCQYFYELCVQDEPRNKPPCEGPSNMSRYSDGVLPDVQFTITNWTEASKEEGYLNLKLMVYDVDDGGYLEAVDYVILEVKGNESDTTIQAKGTFIADTNFAVTLTYKCDENYYGLQCDKMCVPQDSVTGHFKCDNVTGEKSCMDGWTGGDCTTATQPCAGTAPPETGVPVGSCQAIDMLFLLDSSASVNEIDANNWDNLKKFVKGIIDRVTLGPASFQIGIILVGNKANYSIELSKFYSNDELKSSIEALTHEGLKTNLKDGLKLARTEGFKTSNGGRKGAYKCVVVAYAGAALPPAYGAVDKEASGLKDLGADVFVVSLKQGKSQKSVIDSIASQPAATHIWTDLEDWTKLASTVGPTILANAQDTCQRMVASSGTATTGTTLAGSSVASSSTVSTTRSSTVSTTGSTAGSRNSTGAEGGSTTRSSSGGPIFVAQCHYRGTCSAESPSSACYCMAGYSGENCEEEVDPCDSDPCNGGECESGSEGDFICKSCLPGFSGDHCEVVGEEILCAPCTGSDAPGCPPPGASPQCPALPEAPCADHLYGTDCKTFCVPRDDCIEGHYTCDEEGQKVCMPGWKDGTKPCTVPDTATTANCTNTCANGGACYAAGCCCPEGFKGPDCSETTGNMSTPVGTNTTGTTLGTNSTGATTPGTNSTGATTPGTNSTGATTPGTNSTGATTPGTNSTGATTPGTNSTGATTPGTNSTGATTPGTNSTGATTPGTNSTGATTPGTNSTGATTPGTNSTGSTVAQTGSTVAQTQGTGTTARTTMGTATMVSMGSATSGPVTSGGTSTTPKDNMAECLKQIGDFFKFTAPYLSPVQKQAVLNLYLPACLDSSE